MVSILEGIGNRNLILMNSRINLTYQYFHSLVTYKLNFEIISQLEIENYLSISLHEKLNNGILT